MTISVGAVGFAYHNVATIAKFAVFFWALVYLLCITADTQKTAPLRKLVKKIDIRLVVKRVVTHVELSPWGYVYYNNFLALAVYPARRLLGISLLIVTICFRCGQHSAVRRHVLSLKIPCLV